MGSSSKRGSGSCNGGFCSPNGAFNSPFSSPLPGLPRASGGERRMKGICGNRLPSGASERRRSRFIVSSSKIPRGLLPRRHAVCPKPSTPQTLPKFPLFRGPFPLGGSHHSGMKSVTSSGQKKRRMLRVGEHAAREGVWGTGQGLRCSRRKSVRTPAVNMTGVMAGSLPGW